MNIVVNDISELYLMSAILFSSIIFNATIKDNQLIFSAAIPLNGERFMGEIVISDLKENMIISVGKLEFLSSITINKNKHIEITTSHQVITCPIKEVNLHFSYDEELRV